MKTIIKNSNWWVRRTILERCLILLSTFVFVLPTADNKVIFEDTKLLKFCTSDECVSTAGSVLRAMNMDVDPCDDFYQFACGNYISRTEIPDDKARVDVMSDIWDKLFEQVGSIMTSVRPETDPKFAKFPNFLYNACMNTSLIEKLGTKPIDDIVKSLGGWPVLIGESWNSNDEWTWQEPVKTLRRLGLTTGFIVDFSVEVDLLNSTKRIIALDQPFSVGLNRKFLLEGFNHKLVSAYYDYKVDLAVLFGAQREAAENEFKESLQFAMDLAQISKSVEDRRDPNDLYNLRSIKELTETYTYVDWLDYINALLPEGVKVDENEMINLKAPSFFDDLGKLLARTPKRVIANYMMWRIHASVVSFLPERFEKRRFEYASVSSGNKQQLSRTKQCVTKVLFSELRLSLGFLYVPKYFNEDSKTIASEMVKYIFNAFGENLDAVDWMDQMTREKAIEKLNTMISFIGYPNELLDKDKLEEHYRNLVIHPDKYLESMLNMQAFRNDFLYSQLKLPVNKTDWIRHADALNVNAMYTTEENSIQFLAGIMQGRFFNAKRPQYMNYGAIGFVIGHEITHGFDDQGRQYDADGNLVDWWQADTKKKFLEKASCIIKQYGNITDNQTGLSLNGVSTQGENIADNGGIKVAYKAYNQWAKNGKGEEPRLPGLNYTPKQMFWISFAQSWCAKYRTEHLKVSITTDEHSPQEHRIKGSCRNNKLFSRDFNCPVGAPMNPVHKCEVW